jgi:hypothetical protein
MDAGPYATATPFPQIKSLGPPPALHADRVVAEMLQLLIRMRAAMWDDFWAAVASGSFGNPVGQQRLVRRLREAGGLFLPAVLLDPGKRARFTLVVCEIVGWDPDTQAIIDNDDRGPLPNKPWLAVRSTFIEGRGPRLRPDIWGALNLFVTHHALSRLAQRCGAREPHELLLAVRAIWHTFETDMEKKAEFPPAGYRLSVNLPGGLGGAIAALSRHANEDIHAPVVVTILSPSEEAL